MIHAQRANYTALIAPKAQTSAATTTANLDTRGFGYATLLVACSSELNTNAVGPTISVLTSDDTVVTNFATIVADQSAIDLTAARTVLYNVDCRKQKRYLRLSFSTATATNDDVTVSVAAILSAKAIGVTNTTDMVASTSHTVVTV